MKTLKSKGHKLFATTVEQDAREGDERALRRQVPRLRQRPDHRGLGNGYRILCRCIAITKAA